MPSHEELQRNFGFLGVRGVLLSLRSEVIAKSPYLVVKAILLPKYGLDLAIQTERPGKSKRVEFLRAT